MKNKWVRRTVLAGLILMVSVVGLHIVLHVISSRPWLHRKLTEQLAQATGREVRLGHALLNLRGVSVEDFALSKPGGFEKGELFHVKQARVRVSLWHLLYGHFKIKAVEVDGLSLQVVRDEQGKLNVDFSDGTVQADTSGKEETSSGAPLALSIEVLSARQLYLSYEDKQTHLQAELQDVAVSVRNFSWDKPFEVRANASAMYQQDGSQLPAAMGFVAQINLAGLDLPKAQANISSFALRSGSSRLRGEGHVQDFVNPQFTVALYGKEFSSGDFRGFVPQEHPFEIKQISLRAQGVLSTEQEQLRIDDSALLLPGLEMTLGGLMRFARGEYDFSTRLQAQLDKLADGLPFLSSYKLAGALTFSSRVTHKQMSARAELSDGGATLPQVGKLANLQAALDAGGQTNGQNGQGVLGIKGELNGEEIQIDFSFTKTPQEIVAGLTAAAERLILPPAVQAENQPQEDTSAQEPASDAPAEPAQTTPVSAEETAWSLPPITAKADVKFGSIDAPYLNGKDFTFRLDMWGITPKMDGAHGTLALSVSNGKITDLYKLTDSNAIMKVLFMSLKVVGKVFNTLDVLSVLGGLTGSSDKSSGEEVIKMIPDENGEMIPVKVPAHARKVDGALAYDKFTTDVQFDDGVATVKEGSFVSDMMSFNLSGVTDFNTEKINMIVHAAPGKHETTGVMPLTLKIGGTVSEPSGSMSVVGSMASLVKQGVTNNFASRAVKKTVGGVVGLFKKKEKPSPEMPQPVPEQEQPADKE